MDKLLGYVLDGSILGVDLLTWEGEALLGNDVFKRIDSSASIPEDYSDISSIVNWGKYGEQTFNSKQFTNTRKEISYILTPQQKDGSIDTLSQDEIDILSRYQLIDCYKIYDYLLYSYDEIDFISPPHNLDYDIVGLHKKKYYNKGELYKIEYYGSYDFPTNTYSDLVLEEVFTYYRINEMVYKHDLDIYWYINTGVVGTSKRMTKYYTQEQSFALGEQRRRNCITNLKINAVGLIMMTEQINQNQAEQIGWLFLDEFNNQISIFIEGFAQPLKDVVMTSQNHSWLNNLVPNAGGLTVRMFLYDGINIDYTVNNMYI
jgi:hypothetical protein